MRERSSPRWPIARLIARRVAIQGAVWGAVFGLLVLATVSGFTTAFPTLAARRRIAAALSGNVGLRALFGTPRALDTVDVTTGEPAQAHHQRSDVTAVPAAGVVAEAMLALVLAEAALEKFGGDSVAETARNLRGYLDSLTVR